MNVRCNKAKALLSRILASLNYLQYTNCCLGQSAIVAKCEKVSSIVNAIAKMTLSATVGIDVQT